jgi:hypothetical protein
MPPDRWFGIGSCAGAGERAGARAADDALIHDDLKLLIVCCSQAGMIAFDRVARRAVPGEGDTRSEVHQLAAVASGAPAAGCYAYGEIARTRRATRGFHNQPLVVLPIG